MSKSGLFLLNLYTDFSYIMKGVLLMPQEKTRVSREDDFIRDRNVNDISYMILFMAADFDPSKTYRTIKIKEVNYSALTKNANISRQTFAKHIKKLIEIGFITVDEEKEEYILPIPQEHYFDVESTTIRKLNHFAKNNSIKIYVYLLGWYTYYKKYNKEYNFSLDELCEVIGLAPRQTRNREIIKDILEMLERLGLIKVSDTADCPVIINNKQTMHFRLIAARDSLPEMPA